MSEENSRAERRRQILEQAASLDPSIIEKKQQLLALSAAQQSTQDRASILQDVCKNYNPSISVDSSGQFVAVQDPITLEQIEMDDIVVLSDGQCYSRRSMQALLNSGVIDYDSGRATLPLTGVPLSDLDYVLLDRLPPVEGSEELIDARRRTNDVIDATTSEAVRTREQIADEREQRARAEQRRQYTRRFNQAYRPRLRTIPEEN